MTKLISLQKPKFGLVLLLLLGAILALVVMASPASVAAADLNEGDLDTTSFTDHADLSLGDVYTGVITGSPETIPDLTGGFLNFGSFVDSEIFVLGDLDFFEFTAPIGTIFVANLVADFDTLLALYDSSTGVPVPVLLNDDTEETDGTCDADVYPDVIDEGQSCIRYTTTTDGPFSLVVLANLDSGDYILQLVGEFVLTIPDDVTVEATGPTTPRQEVEIGTATATDDKDPDPVISNNAPELFLLGTTTVTWTVENAALNTIQADQVVTVEDTTPPVISLVGDATVTVEVGGTYTEEGAIAADLVDGDVSGSIAIDATAVDTGVAEIYLVTYKVSDAAGNQAIQVTRTVVVVSYEPEEISPRDLKIGAAAALAAYEDDSKKIKKAIKEINKSLEDKGWVEGDDTHLDPKHGKKVFDHEKRAVKDLMKVLKEEARGKHPIPSLDIADVQGAIDDLLAADAALAGTAFGDAETALTALTNGNEKKVEKEIAKSMREMEKALAELDKDKYDKAINKYKKAWEHAQKAINHANK